MNVRHLQRCVVLGSMLVLIVFIICQLMLEQRWDELAILFLFAVGIHAWLHDRKGLRA